MQEAADRWSETSLIFLSFPCSEINKNVLKIHKTIYVQKAINSFDSVYRHAYDYLTFEFFNHSILAISINSE